LRDFAPWRRCAVDELHDFQGTWQAVWLAEDGRKMTPDEVQRTGLTISGDRYTFHLKEFDLHGVIGRVDRTRNRGAVDFVPEGQGDAGKTCLGVYVLEDDELSVCVAPPGRDRPTSFAPQRGSGHSLYLLRRCVPSRVRPVQAAVC
jgi:uncharacterized protein (TIGR03067 family)